MTTQVNTKVTIISNADNEAVNGAPVLLSPRQLKGGTVREQVGQFAFGASESNNSTYRVGRVSSGERVSSILLVNDALTSSAVVDIGLYDIAANGGAVVSQHLFAQGASMTSARTAAPYDARFAALNANTAEQAVWQLLGLSADPGKEYDLVLTATTRGTGTGNCAVTTRTVSNS